jgi:hypothetical protein
MIVAVAAVVAVAVVVLVVTRYRQEWYAGHHTSVHATRCKATFYTLILSFFVLLAGFFLCSVSLTSRVGTHG